MNRGRDSLIERRNTGRLSASVSLFLGGIEVEIQDHFGARVP